MKEFVKSHFEEQLRPFTKSARSRQVAAVCYRQTPAGKEVLLITSRGTGRWIVPKGWPIDGLSDAQAARQEAWEEAGVKSARVEPDPVGHYDYDKYHGNGGMTPVQTQVFLAEVTQLSETYPEVHQRERRWFPPAKAASLVREPELKALLRRI